MANNNVLQKELTVFVRTKTNHCCWYCGRKFTTLGAQEEDSFTIDHIIPLDKGGSRVDINNLVPACQACNYSKGNKRLEVWRKEIGVRKFYFEEV